jgi:uncharacterized protein (DUF1499 family)
MSHRVTTQTDMKNKDYVVQACKSAGISYVEAGKDLIRFTSGGVQNAVLNLRTGEISGDTDYGHTRDKLGALRQAYGEAAYRAECLKQGITVEDRQVDREGNVVLMWSMG